VYCNTGRENYKTAVDCHNVTKHNHRVRQCKGGKDYKQKENGIIKFEATNFEKKESLLIL
jgi:hypothetical protein